MGERVKQIYLDYASTTLVDPRVIQAMTESLTNDYGNPSSRSHTFGWQAEQSVEEARQNIADLFHADPREIIFTSGATESNNLAIKGAARFYQTKGKHIITCKTEHKAVLDACRQLEREGFEVTYLTPNTKGLLSLEQITQAIRPDTILVSLMHVNNEIGVIHPIEQIGAMLREKNILFHVDAAQSTGKLAIDLSKICVDLLSVSGHKIYGPKGIGALYVRRKPRVRLEAQIHGGGQERGMRSGTLATHQIVGLGMACKLAKAQMQQDYDKAKALSDRLWAGVKSIEAVQINGDETHRLPNILNISFNYVEGESLIMGLKELAISSGSACTSASLEPSYVLHALGLSEELAHSSLRFSVGRFTTEAEIDKAIELIKNTVDKLRQMSPLWDMYQAGIDLSTIKWAEH
jgi:cysteine desulfurase